MITQQYAELAELAGGFIHEIKNHLSTLGLNLQLLAEDFQDPQTQRERRALQRVQRLQRLQGGAWPPQPCPNSRQRVKNPGFSPPKLLAAPAPPSHPPLRVKPLPGGASRIESLTFGSIGPNSRHAFVLLRI